MSNFTSSSYSFSSSSSNSGSGHHSSGQAQSTQSYTDASGNKVVKTTKQNMGEAPITETHRFDAQGRKLESLEGANQSGPQSRIQDVTDIEERENMLKADKLYEERMEEEYAKREGGA